MNAQPVYVIDTSYLLELYAVPGYSTQEAVDEIRRRFDDAVRQNARLFVTVPSIYELANHIADVSDGNARWSLGKRLRDAILSSIDGGVPWTIVGYPGVGSRLPKTFDEGVPRKIVPFQQLSAFKKLIASFADNYVLEGIGLSNSTLIDEADRLKRTTYRGSAWRVHIWTKDEKLKAREPDDEPHAYLG